MTASPPVPPPAPAPPAGSVDAPRPAPEPAPPADRFASPVPVANPALVGVPTFMVGSIALGLVLVGFVPQTLAGGPIAVIFAATGLGQVIATIFALRAGESAVAGVFGVFAGFWLSYAIFVLGVVHNWYGFTTPPPGASATAAAAAAAAAVLAAQKLFLLSWLIIIVVLTLISLRLPSAFTLLFVLVDLALLFVYLGTVNASTGEMKVGGVIVFCFVAVGAYLWADAYSAATGGKNFPLGRPVLK